MITSVMNFRVISLTIFLGLLLASKAAGGQLFSRKAKNRDLNEVAGSSLQPGTCPCVKPPGSNSCLAFINDRYQAATLDEVVMNFMDLTVLDPTMATNIFGQKIFTEGIQSKPNGVKCKTAECSACYNALGDRLLQSVPSAESPSLGIVPQVIPNVVHGAPPPHCQRLTQPKYSRKTTVKPGHPGGNGVARPASPTGNGGSNGPASGSASGTVSGSGSASSPTGNQGQGSGPAPIVPEDAAWLILGELGKHSTASPQDSGSTVSSSNNSSGASGSTMWHNSSNTWNNSTWTTSHYGIYSTAAPRPRRRRDSPPGSTSGSLGTVTPLDCSYKKGDPVDDGSGYVGLCNLCWSLRTLSPKYFPRYVNELSCDSSDNGCLSGYAKCRERYRSIDVLYNTGTDAAPKWQQYSINSPVACECQVLSGSAMHDVFTKGKSSS